jgi:predicted metal-dependent phosphoesterase TrpH
MTLLKADLHIHTRYSMDCRTPLEKIIARCQRIGINCLAIADHGTIEGALKMQTIAPFPVIVAEEIWTPDGEIMGVFLKEGVPKGLTPEEVISRVKAQGGLVCIPHPYDKLLRHGIAGKLPESLARQIDYIEVFNSRSLIRQPSTEAQLFAEKYNIPVISPLQQHVGHLKKAAPEVANVPFRLVFHRKR